MTNSEFFNNSFLVYSFGIMLFIAFITTTFFWKVVITLYKAPEKIKKYQSFLKACQSILNDNKKGSMIDGNEILILYYLDKDIRNLNCTASTLFRNDAFTKKAIDITCKTRTTSFPSDYLLIISKHLYYNECNKEILIDLAFKIARHNKNDVNDFFNNIHYNFYSLIEDEEFVRQYCAKGIKSNKNYNAKKWLYDFCDDEEINYADNEIDFDLLIKEAYKEFEEKRLLALLPAKQDEAPIKTKKKI